MSLYDNQEKELLRITFQNTFQNAISSPISCIELSSNEQIKNKKMNRSV